jgi:hypothetical protein
MAMYQHGKADGGFRLGIEMVIQLALQSPHFLYRVELGEPIDGDGEIIALDDWEIASRLSYLIWGSMPDDTLFAAAAAGALSTPADIETQARRMLDDPRAHQVIENFHQQWLDYDRIKSAGKDGTLFPDYSPIIGELMRLETASFVDHVVFGDAGDLATLLTAPYSFMNADLAAFYGVSGPSGADFELTGGDAPRSGLLSIGALMTLNAHSNQTSPVHRGKLVREQLLCDIMPPPPDDVMITVPEPDPNSTARERFAQHSADPACSGCHELLDPIGFGFENYDAVGRYRTMEAGQPIDASGAIIQSDVDGAFNGVVDLGQKLAQSEDVMACYTQQWFRYGYGRGESKQDACTMQALVADMVASGGDIRELVVALTRTVSFTHKRIGGAQ